MWQVLPNFSSVGRNAASKGRKLFKVLPFYSYGACMQHLLLLTEISPLWRD
jgi:hypothetical protein